MQKQEAYSKLFELSDSGVDITEAINSLAVSDTVTESVLEFLSSHDKFNIEFLENLSSKKFYKSITTSTDLNEQAKGLSSMLTHVIIEMQNHPDNRKMISSSIDISKITEGLTAYIVDEDSDKLKESVDYVNKILKKGE